MRINIICQYFYPEIGAPQARLSEMARYWAKQGHEVSVFTGFPNYPTGIISPEYRGRIFQKEEHDGYIIYRHWLYATPNKGFIKRVMGQLSFMLSVIFMSLFRGKKPDVIVVSSPPLFSVFSAWIISRIRRTPYVFEVRDLWPGIFKELGLLSPRIISILEWFELSLYRGARQVTPVTFGFKKNMSDRGIPENKIHVITNGVDLDFFDKRPEVASREDYDIPEDAFVLLYIGAHGPCQGLPSVLDAAIKTDKKIVFLFIGEGQEKQQMVDRANELKIGNVIFRSAVPREKVPGLYRMADACLVPLKDSAGFSMFIPSKIFEIMACETPIIGALKGEAANILEESKAALLISPEDPDALLEAISELQQDPENCKTMGKVGRDFVEQHYDREKLAQKYLDVLGSKN